jgi:hypothetical protein
MMRQRRRPPEVHLRDAAGRPTTDPAEAVTGEVVDVGDHRSDPRVRFFLTREELPWLPVSESAFLLWVFAGLVLVWFAIGIGLLLLS